MSLSNKALDAVFMEAAHDNLGIYPAAFSGKYEKRTDWMEGWNACAMQHNKNRSTIEHWWIALDDKARATLEPLLINRHIYLHIADGDSVEMKVNCNDLFFWGCADAEDISLEQLHELIACCDAAGKDGELLWCARKRQMRPQGAYYKHFPKETWPLFDACGDKRETGFGNPLEPGK